MSFSPEWLALREPADHAARNPDVAAALQKAFSGRASARIVDLGCGAGSNLRGMYGSLPGRQHWTLVDYDPVLLQAARSRLKAWADAVVDDAERLVIEKEGRSLYVSFRQADLAAGPLSPVLGDAELVTAAALFDLVSVDRIEAVAEAVVAARAYFMTVLTYDGHAAWAPAHALDPAMRDSFNAHQKSDKGFGPAAGPGGTSALSKAFYRRGYRVLRGTSPWVVDARYGALRTELDEGWAGAVRETGAVAAAEIDAWLASRRSATEAVTIVGHEDLLAAPG